jgi:hypothetical protein
VKKPRPKRKPRAVTATPQSRTLQKTAAPSAPQSWLRLALNHPAWLVMGAVAVLVGLISGLESIVGAPFWPTAPIVQFEDTIDASSTILPFKIINRSVLFDMNLQITCSVDLFYFIDGARRTGLQRGFAFNVGPIVVPANSVSHYPCSASDYIYVERDGSLHMGSEKGRFMRTPIGTVLPPLTTLKMCLSMYGTYRVLGWKIPFSSAMFQWPAKPGLHQWIEGPPIPDLPDEAWIPPNSTIGGAWSVWGRLLDPSGERYMPGALQCHSR